MGKSYTKAKGRTPSNFIMLRHDIIDSPAWQSLHPEAIGIWILLARRYNGNNNGEIPLSCREAARSLHISKDTAGKYFNQLIDAGLVIVTENSGFNRKNRTSRRFALTHQPLGNNPPTNSWKNAQ